MPLIEEVNEAEETVPLDSWSQAYKMFDGMPPYVVDQTSNLNLHKIDPSINKETPKSRLNSTHKRNSETVYQKRQKRQLVGDEGNSVVKPLDTNNDADSSRSSDNISQAHNLRTSQRSGNSAPTSVQSDKCVSSGKQRKSTDRNQELIVPTSQYSKRTSAASEKSHHAILTSQNVKPSANQKLSLADLTSGNEIETSVNIPVTATEADQLLASIRNKTVTLDGMQEEQIKELAKCVAAMTRTDFNLVYNLLKLLPKELNSNESKSHSSESQKTAETMLTTSGTSQPGSPSKNENSTQTFVGPNSMTFRGSDYSPKVFQPLQNRDTIINSSSTNQYLNVSKPTHATSSTFWQHHSDPIGRPISSVIPMSADPVRSDSQQVNQYLQSTTIRDRRSDPQRSSIYPQHEYQRLAVSVSPVMQRQCNDHFFTPDVPCSSNRVSTDSTFHPLAPSRDSFRPTPRDLTAFSENFGSFNRVPNTTQRNTGSSDSYSSYGEGIIFPKDISFNACCMNTTTTRIVQMMNSNKCWMHCKLQIIFVACNGEQVLC